MYHGCSAVVLLDNGKDTICCWLNIPFFSPDLEPIEALHQNKTNGGTCWGFISSNRIDRFGWIGPRCKQQRIGWTKCSGPQQPITIEQMKKSIKSFAICFAWTILLRLIQVVLNMLNRTIRQKKTLNMERVENWLDQMRCSSTSNDNWIDKGSSKIFSCLHCLNHTVEVYPNCLRHFNRNIGWKRP